MAKKNLILIVCDALRRDHLSCYGYPKPTTPNIDKLAAQGIKFENAFCQTNVTAPSITTILTGRYPWTTGVTEHFSERSCFLYGDEAKPSQHLDPQFKMLAEILYRNGYSTFSSEWLGEWFKRGNVWTMAPTYFEGPIYPADKLTEWALTRMQEKPYFLFLHYWEGHWPGTAPRSYADKFYDQSLGDPTDPEKGKSLEPIVRSYSPEALRNFVEKSMPITSLDYMLSQYDGDVNFMDEQLGRVFEAAGDDTLIVLTADHGENLGEDGWYFVHYGLKDSILRVPLIFKYPMELPLPQDIAVAAPALMEEFQRLPVEHVDVVPSILELLRVKPECEFDGRSIFASDYNKDAVYAMETRTRIARSMRTRDYKLIQYISQVNVRWRPQSVAMVKHELYNLQVDPGETVNVASQRRKTLLELDEKLQVAMPIWERTE